MWGIYCKSGADTNNNTGLERKEKKKIAVSSVKIYRLDYGSL